MLSQMPEKNFNEQLVRAAINNSYVGGVADAVCFLPPRATLDNIIKKFKWMYGSVVSFDSLIQEFYQIIKGKSERVQTFVLHLECVLKAIKQQQSPLCDGRRGHETFKSSFVSWIETQHSECTSVHVQ